jgi:hypothetical protein
MITTGADGNVWFTTNQGASWLGRMTPSGSLRWVQTQGVRPDWGITSGPDGNLWFPCSTARSQAICRMNPSTSELTAFARPLDEGEGAAITSGADGNLWFTQPGRGRLARITPAGVISEFPAIPVHIGVSPIGSRAVRVRLLCPAASVQACRGAIQLSQVDRRGGEHRAGSARFQLAPGTRRAFVVPLWRRWRQRLLARGHLVLGVHAGRLFTGSSQMVASTRTRWVRLRSARRSRPWIAVAG